MTHDNLGNKLDKKEISDISNCEIISDDIIEDEVMTLKEVEIREIKKFLRIFERNMTKAGKALGISRSAFYNKMKKYGL